MIWRCRTGSPWRDRPSEHGAWQTVHHRFPQWRDVGVFEQLMDGMIAEAACRGQVDLPLISVDSGRAGRCESSVACPVALIYY
ncbi:transposase [Streptomyces sp. NPDC040750]|uniref:transposase n=1 Tax=Streptomyces sp. NPDC040750 TaxID=3154491 RepID=UPI0033D95359